MEEVQLSRGNSYTPTELTGITATTTSAQKYSKGHNAIIIYFNLTAGSGSTFTIKIQGKSDDGVFIDMYDNNGNQMAMTSVTVDKAQFFVGLPRDFKIVATEAGDGSTATISYELMTV